MSPQAKAHLSAIAKARWDAKPRDGSCRVCGEPIVIDYSFCLGCWIGLPADRRGAIIASMTPGLPIAKQSSPAYRAAIDAACDEGPF